VRSGRLGHLLNEVAATRLLRPVDVVGPAGLRDGRDVSRSERRSRIHAARAELASRARAELGMSDVEIAEELGFSASFVRDLSRKAPFQGPAAAAKKARGERHGAAKLTDEQADEIRSAVNLTGEELAARYGVASSTISRIRTGGRRGAPGARSGE
jgi:DNA-binding transcriptional regulator YiaG